MPSWASYASGTHDLPCPCSRSREDASEVARTRRRATPLPACAARALWNAFPGAPPETKRRQKAKRSPEKITTTLRVMILRDAPLARARSARRPRRVDSARARISRTRGRTGTDGVSRTLKHFLTRTSSRATRRRRLLFDHPVSRSLRALSCRLAAGGGGAREKRFSPQIRRTSSLSYPRG